MRADVAQPPEGVRALVWRPVAQADLIARKAFAISSARAADASTPVACRRAVGVL
jgi:hypothetical protein